VQEHLLRLRTELRRRVLLQNGQLLDGLLLQTLLQRRLHFLRTEGRQTGQSGGRQRILHQHRRVGRVHGQNLCRIESKFVQIQMTRYSGESFTVRYLSERQLSGLLQGGQRGLKIGSGGRRAQRSGKLSINRLATFVTQQVMVVAVASAAPPVARCHALVDAPRISRLNKRTKVSQIRHQVPPGGLGRLNRYTTFSFRNANNLTGYLKRPIIWTTTPEGSRRAILTCLCTEGGEGAGACGTPLKHSN